MVNPEEVGLSASQLVCQDEEIKRSDT